MFDCTQRLFRTGSFVRSQMDLGTRVRRPLGLAATALCTAILAGCASGPVMKSLPPTSEAHRGMDKDIRVVGDYYLPVGYISLTIKRDANKPATITAGDPSYRPDPRAHYTVQYMTDRWSADHIVVETDGQGFLKSVAPTSQDATAQIIAKVIELAGTVANTATTLTPKLARFTTSAPECKVAADVAIDKQYFINPANLTKPEHDRIWDETCVDVTVEPLVPRREDGTSGTASDASGVQPDSIPAGGEGIFYRSAIPFEITARDRAKVVRTFLVTVPDTRVTLMARLDRRAITGLHTTLTFTNGMLTKFESDDPNQAAAALQIPIDALTAIAGIIPKIVSVSASTTTTAAQTTTTTPPTTPPTSPSAQ